MIIIKVPIIWTETKDADWETRFLGEVEVGNGLSRISVFGSDKEVIEKELVRQLNEIGNHEYAIAF